MSKATFTMTGRETSEHEVGNLGCPRCFYPGFPRMHACGGLEHVEGGYGVYRDVSEQLTKCDGCSQAGSFLDQ